MAYPVQAVEFADAMSAHSERKQTKPHAQVRRRMMVNGNPAPDAARKARLHDFDWRAP
jgi:hypothetical protein